MEDFSFQTEVDFVAGPLAAAVQNLTRDTLETKKILLDQLVEIQEKVAAGELLMS